MSRVLTVCCVSDMHGALVPIPPCDLLVLSGDICPEASAHVQVHWLDHYFRPWLKEQPVLHGTVATWGNHDCCGQLVNEVDELHLRWHMLVDQRIVLAGVKIYGAPWQPRCAGAFNMIEPDLETKWSRIPDDTQLLVLHGPPHGFGDGCHGTRQGSRSLLHRIRQIRPALVTFGHIHEGRGAYEDAGVTLVNASLRDAAFNVVHQPWVGEVDFEQERLRPLSEVYAF